MGHVLDVSDDSQIVMTSMFPMSKNCHIFNEGNDEDVLSLSVMTVMFFTSVITAAVFKSVMGFFFLMSGISVIFLLLCMSAIFDNTVPEQF